jgi:hypothetical protein
MNGVDGIQVGTLLRGVIVFLVVVVAVSSAFPPIHVFHFLNAAVIAVAFTVVAVYSPGLIDIVRNNHHAVSAAHLLTVGIVASWAGLAVRLGRWYVFNEEPTSPGFEQWFYNLGLWATIAGGILLIVAVAYTDDRWTRRTTWFVITFGTIVAIVLGLIDHVY